MIFRRLSIFLIINCAISTALPLHLIALPLHLIFPYRFIPVLLIQQLVK